MKRTRRTDRVGAVFAGLILALRVVAFPQAHGRIAFVRTDDGRSDIMTMEPDGRDVRNLTAGAVGNAISPAWSPDGTRIAFASDREEGS